MAERSGAAARVVAQIGPLGDGIDDRLREQYDLLPLWQVEGREAMSRRAAEVRVVVTSVRYGCTAELMAMLPGLGAICSWGVGHETLDMNAARVRGVQVSNTPDVLDDCVADLAWGLLLATARHICDAERYVRSGSWRAIGEFPLATKVSGKRLGILGLGRIGDAIARRGGPASRWTFAIAIDHPVPNGPTAICRRYATLPNGQTFWRSPAWAARPRVIW